MSNNFPYKRLERAAETSQRLANAGANYFEQESAAALVDWVVAMSELIRSQGGPARELSATSDGIQAVDDLVRKLKSVVCDLSDSVLQKVGAYFHEEVQVLWKELLGEGAEIDLERMAELEEDELTNLFIKVDTMELVSGLLLEFLGDDSVSSTVSPVVNLVHNAPWIFLDIVDFIADWSGLFDDDDAMHPLWIQLSRAKFEAVLRHSECALAGLDVTEPIPEPIRLASIVNNIVAEQPVLLAALVGVSSVETHDFRFLSPNRDLLAEMSVPVSAARSDAALDVVILPNYGRDSQDLDAIRGLIGKRIRFGLAEGEIGKAAANGAQASLEISALKRMPFAEACLYVDDVRWDLTE